MEQQTFHNAFLVFILTPAGETNEQKLVSNMNTLIPTKAH